MRELERSLTISRQLFLMVDVILIYLTAQLVTGMLDAGWLGLPDSVKIPFFLVIATYLSAGIPLRGIIINRNRSWVNEFLIVLSSWAIASVTLLTYFYFSKTGFQYSRLWFGLWLTASPFVLIIGRLLAGRLLTLFGISQIYHQTALIIAPDNDENGRLLKAFSAPKSSIKVTDTVTIPDACDDDAAQDATIKQICDRIELGDINTLIIGPTDKQPLIKKLQRQMLHYSIDILTYPSNYNPEMVITDAQIIDGVPMLVAQSRPIKGIGQIAKAVEDRVLGFLLLLAFTPLMLIVAILIKLDSKGPVLFIQPRHGFNHDKFKIYKFRTMHGGDDGAKQATKQDDRITKVGKWLRRTSIDELPQLINVVQGHMSLVGPRPHPVAQRDAYAQQIDSWLSRHKVKPGITGWAQINGYRGEISNDEELIRRVEHDLYYIDNWSVFFDLRILFATPLKGFVHPKAY